MAIFISVALALVLSSLWIRERTRFARRLESIAARQGEMESALNGFMEESEKIALELSRLVFARQAPAAPPAAAERNSSDKICLVLGLAQKGHSAPEIAGRLLIPRGEVELILNLNTKGQTRNLSRLGAA